MLASHAITLNFSPNGHCISCLEHSVLHLGNTVLQRVTQLCAAGHGKTETRKIFLTSFGRSHFDLPQNTHAQLCTAGLPRTAGLPCTAGLGLNGQGSVQSAAKGLKQLAEEYFLLSDLRSLPFCLQGHER